MTRVETSLGALVGRTSGGCELFFGVPYAAPPVDERRFRPPEPVAPWTGDFDATSFGPSAWQPGSAEGSPLPRVDREMDEDCLRLNVCTPAIDGGTRPVLVWIHGGSYTNGSGDRHDGRSFSQVGDLVVVTVNYRLGPFGWLDLGHLDPSYAGSHNNGVLDLVEALRWVRDHIARFGGDPAQVTICGESAGAGCVAALLAAPAAQGLFHRAISQSAPAGFGAATPGFGERFTDIMDADDPFTADPQRLVDAHKRLSEIGQNAAAGTTRLADGCRGWRPVVDGAVLTARPAEAVAARGASAVPLLLGTNVDEGTLFSAGIPATVSDDDLRGAVAEHTDDPERVITAFRAEHPGQDNRHLATHMLTDTLFRTPSLRLADAQADAGGSVHVYRFSWPSQGFDGVFGALHGLDIPFVWNSDLTPWQPLIGAGSPQPPDLAMQMHHAWIAFTRTGDPDHEGIDTWPRYDTGRRPTMDFGDTTRVLDDPAGATRACWS